MGSGSTATHLKVKLLAILLLSLAVLPFRFSSASSTIQLSDSAIAKSVTSSGDAPIGRTQAFQVSDTAVYSWLHFVNIYSPTHNVTSVWLTPQKHTFFRYVYTIPDPGQGYHWTDYYVYDSIGIQGYTAQFLPGAWSVSVYIDNVLSLTQNFTITDTTLQSEPTEGFVWPTYNIPVYIQATPSYAYQDVVLAMKQWNYSQTWFQQQYGLPARSIFNFVVSSDPSAPVKVVFNQTQSSSNWGWTQYHYNWGADQTFTSVTCSISIVLKLTDGTTLGATPLETVAEHELGHCLGLAHATFSGDLMNHSSPNLYDVFYPSTLDLYAMYQLASISKYGQVPASFTLPSSIPYAQSPGYDVTVTTTSTTTTSTSTSSTTTSTSKSSTTSTSQTTTSSTTTTSSSTSTSQSSSTSTTTSSTSSSHTSTTTVTPTTTTSTTTPVLEFPNVDLAFLLLMLMVALAFMFVRMRGRANG